jgi:hypothetical protein
MYCVRFGVEGLILQAVAVLVGVSGAGFVSLLGVTTNDLIDSIFVLASLLGVLKVAERTGEPADWAWPGLWFGIAFGLNIRQSFSFPDWR